MPRPAAAEPNEIVSERFVLQPDGSAQLSVVTRYRLREAPRMRHRFATTLLDEVTAPCDIEQRHW